VESGVSEKQQDIDLVKGQFEDFCDATQAMRELARKCRNYRDGKQWTDEEIKILKQRKQPIITDNKVFDTVNTLLGLERQYRTDPKAFPRTPDHEQAAEAATDALRFVADKCDYQRSARKPATENLIIEGWCYGEVCLDKQTNEIRMEHVRIDRGYHDIRSLRPDFADKEYCGYFTWMDLEVARKRWKGKESALDESFSNISLGEDEHEDKPNKYVELRGGRKRVQIFTHYHKVDGVWHFSRWCKGGFLEDPKPSPYQGEKGEPACNIEIQALYRDADGACYGAVQRDLDLQDEHNKRRSKLLHLLNAKRIKMRQGAVEDIGKLRNEAHKPDGVIEITGSPDDLVIEDNLKEADGQWRLLVQTEAALSRSSPNSGMTDPTGASGRAKEIDQAASSLPLTPLFDAVDAWEIRMYRLAWLCVRQFWKAPMWVRVTDNEDNLKFVGLNQPVTKGEALAQELAKEQIPDEQKQAVLQQIAAMPDAQVPVRTENDVAEMDVDIIISRSQDTVNIQAEQFEMLMALAEKRPEVSFKTMLTLSQVRSDVKKMVMDDLTGANDPQAKQMAALQQQMSELQMALQAANVRKTEAQAAQAEAAAVESQVDASVKVAQFIEQPSQAETQVRVS
jgi:hypothetical protein